MKLLNSLRSACVAGALGILVGYGAPSYASLVYTLDNSGSFGTGPFGTVTLTQDGTNTVDVLVTLNAGLGFINAGFPGRLVFNLAGNPALSAANFNFITSGFSFNTGTPLFHEDGSGNWEYALLCTTAKCGTGGNAPFAGPLEFKVTVAGLTESSFVGTNDSNFNFFAADLCFNVAASGACTPGAFTGVAWTNTPPEQNAPEPGSLALLGIAALALARSRRNGNA